jgi:hypothetical protein
MAALATAQQMMYLAVFDPGQGVEPPGQATTGMHTMMSWAAAIGLWVCLACLIGAGAMLAASHFGHGSPKISSIGWVLFGVAIISSAAPIIDGVA